MAEEKKDSLLLPDITKEEGFRQRISTVGEDGDRKWIFPKKPFGKFHNARVFVTIFQLAVLFGMPFVRVNGEPLILLNVIERKFILFGITFWPQDFFILALLFIVSIVFIVLFTVLFGRIFCGWVCPQTVFMEMVFRKIEYWIEGDFNKQKALAKAPWTKEKMFKKGLKHIVFFAIAVLIANVTLAYIIGTDELFTLILSPISEHALGFVLMIVFSAVFYWIFGWFREQVCLIACPYGRLQGVMLNNDSVVVAYDYVRGEPRGKLKKNQETNNGDCVTCNLCVHVCPTGIDIRNGTQLECVNCTACIDVCDHVMDKVDKPKGLIRYASENNIKNGTKFKFDGRVKIYSAILLLLVAGIVVLLSTREDVQATILRSGGSMFKKEDNGNYSNVYEASLINKTADTIHLSIKIENKQGIINLLNHEWTAPPQSIIKRVIILELPKVELEGMSTKLKLGIYDDKGELLTTTKTKFLGPIH